MYLHAHTVTCQLVTLHDGMAYNSTEIVWNAEPKDVVYMSPYVLAFTADTVEIRMASNGSLIQTIAVPDLHLLSKKVKYQPNFIAHFYLAALTLPLLPLLSPLPLLASSPSHHRATSLFSPEKQSRQSETGPIVPTKFQKYRL